MIVKLIIILKAKKSEGADTYPLLQIFFSGKKEKLSTV